VIEDVPLSSALSSQPVLPHDVGVSSTRTRRRFTAAFKLEMLSAAAQCTKPGELGALLRREGLYSSHLSVWRAAARRGELAGLSRRRGPRPTPPDPSVKRIADLERQLVRATARAERLALIVELQKKVAQLLGLALPASGEPSEGP
jgi:transposase-like protein